MKRASRFLLCLALCALLCAALALSAGAVSAPGSNHWVIDYNNSANTTFPAQQGSGWYYVWLFPGDTVEFVAPTDITGGTGGHVNSYTMGAQLWMNGAYADPNSASAHLSVQTETHGIANEGCSNVFITKVTCVGNQPVFFYENGSGSVAKESVNASYDNIVYTATDWGYVVADSSVSVKYVYKDTNGNVIDTNTYKVYNAPTVTSVAAADGQSRTQCPGTNGSVTLSTPCIEGYQFKSWSVSYGNSAGESVYQPYLNGSTLTWDLCSSVGKNAGSTYGSGAVITLTATFYPNWYTLTLDANGGTIDGAATMGYEAKTTSTFSFALSDKTPVRTGYTFAGWYTDKTYTTKVENLSELLTNWYLPHIGRLYAKWTSNGGGTGGGSSTKTTGWVQEGDNWYYYSAGVPVTSQWKYSGRSWYYLDYDGVMATGWLEIDDEWYYFKANGAMLTGWFQGNNTWYYLKANGAMATGWVKSGGYWYYLDADGVMQTGWQEIGDCWYYL